MNKNKILVTGGTGFIGSPLSELLVEKGFSVTKRIGLLGASVTQHPQFSDLLTWLNKDYFDDMHLSILAIKKDNRTSEFVKLVLKHHI